MFELKSKTFSLAMGDMLQAFKTGSESCRLHESAGQIRRSGSSPVLAHSPPDATLVAPITHSDTKTEHSHISRPSRDYPGVLLLSVGYVLCLLYHVVRISKFHASLGFCITLNLPFEGAVAKPVEVDDPRHKFCYRVIVRDNQSCKVLTGHASCL